MEQGNGKMISLTNVHKDQSRLCDDGKVSLLTDSFSYGRKT